MTCVQVFITGSVGNNHKLPLSYVSQMHSVFSYNVYESPVTASNCKSSSYIFSVLPYMAVGVIVYPWMMSTTLQKHLSAM